MIFQGYNVVCTVVFSSFLWEIYFLLNFQGKLKFNFKYHDQNLMTNRHVMLGMMRWYLCSKCKSSAKSRHYILKS